MLQFLPMVYIPDLNQSIQTQGKWVGFVKHKMGLHLPLGRKHRKCIWVYLCTFLP